MRNVAALMAVIPLPKRTGGGTSLAPRERHYLVEMSYKVKLTVVFGQLPAPRTRNTMESRPPFAKTSHNETTLKVRIKPGC